MSNFRHRLPPMTSLVVFEAAARLGSFTRAASELGITQAAVSRQIQTLEKTLRTPLFRRLHRSIEMTEHGHRLSVTMSDALGGIARTVRAIGDETQPGQLVVAAYVAFTHFWLLPKISRFRRANPDLKIKIVTQDTNVDVLRDDVDLAIRYGNGQWSDGEAILLFKDEIFPVCSPDYLTQRSAPACVTDLVCHDLIVSDSPHATWTGWEGWLAAFGQTLNQSSIALRCSFYTDAIHAALAGEGIVLGWHKLVDELMSRNQLVRVLQEALPTQNAYYVMLKPDRASRPAVGAFLRWIQAESDEMESR